MRNNMLNYLKNLTQCVDARTVRASSWDQTGRNKDYWLIEEGTTATLSEMEGPGCINHIWMTSFCRKVLGPNIQDPVLGSSIAPVAEMENAEGIQWELNDPDYYRKVLIKMTWEDAERPSVLVPLGDFFCIGHGMPASFNSIPFNVSSREKEEYTYGGTASMNCYFPMPFNKKAKIEIINENERPVGIFFHIDYELYKEEMTDIAYFHALWHRECPCKGWGDNLVVNSPEVNSVSNLSGEDNYTFLDIKGKGYFVGCNLSVTHFQQTWWGEGDDMIYIDGEKVPSINGTGAEDYFNHAWGMQNQGTLYNGTILHESKVPGYQVSYRFHITDPIHFAESIRVTMEHGHANHLSDDWASTAYWYQSEIAEGIDILPASKRLPLKREMERPQSQQFQLEGEKQQAQEKRDKRMEEYLLARQKQVNINMERTQNSMKGNVELSEKVRRKYMEK